MKGRLTAAILILGAHATVGCALSNQPLPEGKKVSVRGVTTEVTSTYVDLRTKQGYVVRLRLDSATRFVARGHASTRECAVPGSRLEARAIVEGRSWKATDVTIFSGECARRQP